MHVPPFREASRFDERGSDKFSLPFFSCKMVGDLLFETAKNNPNKSFTVLSGHTLEAYHYQPLPNLEIRVGAAEYGVVPKIEFL